MRSETEMMALILQVAQSDERIRAVVLNGSRANPTIQKDAFQDYDIVYIVRQMDTFLQNNTWVDVFGERLILQMPDQMCIGEKNEHSFAYLMLFKDGNRLDLTLFPVERLATHFETDSLTVVLLDKDGLFQNVPAASEKDYLIQPPLQKEFSDVCNEFWWVSSYVLKGLCRNEITYAKYMLDVPMRDMFFKMMEWYIGIQTHFSVSVGKAGRRMKQYLEPVLYERMLATYSDASPENTWKSLLQMTFLFGETARKVAQDRGLIYNREEEHNMIAYIDSYYKASH